MQSHVGSTIGGKYLAKRLIGAGGMGVVYEGEHVEIGKRVAVKVIDPGRAGSPEIAARFRREARATSAVESECIVQVFDVGYDPAIGLYMVMEYLEGEDLAVRLGRLKRLEPLEVATVGVQVARALTKAHGAGVIHRDLKPANIFLTRRSDGEPLVKLLDFGISKLLRSDRPSMAPGVALTRVGTAVGTPQYMSPEQAQGLEVDGRTDIWSLGTVLYEALAGVPLYKEMPTYEQTIVQILLTPPVPLLDVAPWVPERLARVIDCAVSRELDTRIPNAERLAELLTAAVPMIDVAAVRRMASMPDIVTPFAPTMNINQERGPSGRFPGSSPGDDLWFRAGGPSLPRSVPRVTAPQVPVALAPPAPPSERATSSRQRSVRLVAAAFGVLVGIIGLLAMRTLVAPPIRPTDDLPNPIRTAPPASELPAPPPSPVRPLTLAPLDPPDAAAVVDAAPDVPERAPVRPLGPAVGGPPKPSAASTGSQFGGVDIDPTY